MYKLLLWLLKKLTRDNLEHFAKPNIKKITKNYPAKKNCRKNKIYNLALAANCQDGSELNLKTMELLFPISTLYPKLL